MSFWTAFWLTNIHFAIRLFGALTFLIAGYVLLATWMTRKKFYVLLRAIGFGVFAVFFAVSAGGDAGSLVLPVWKTGIQSLALFLIVISFFLDPVQGPPESLIKEREADSKSSKAFLFPLVSGGLALFNSFLNLLVSLRLFFKFTKGFEKELKFLFGGFVALFVSTVITSLAFLRESQYVLAFRIFSDFGIAWIAVHCLELIGFVMVALWAWGYLRFKLVTQIVGGMVAASLFLFIAVTFSYTSLLVSAMQESSLSNLKINLRIFQYALEGYKDQALATTSLVASNQSIEEALTGGNKERLSNLAQEKLISSKMDFLAIVNAQGQVVARGEDPEAVGEALGSNFVVSSALENEPEVDMTVRDWINAPQVLIEAAVPVGKVGAVYAGYLVDNAFVDGVKEVTDLDVTVYGGSARSATTFLSNDGVSRLVGVEEANAEVKSLVLEEGELFLGLNKVIGREYLSAYGPFKSIDEKVLGMLFVGYPSVRLFEAAQVALNRTFFATAVLAMLSIGPAYLLAKFIEKHQV